MKRLAWCVCVVVVGVLASASLALGQMSPEVWSRLSDGSTHEVVFTIPVGKDGVQYEGEGPEILTWGPTALAVAPDGTFWVADAVGNRLLHFSPTGRHLGTIELEAHQIVGVEDLEATAYGILVLDIGAMVPKIVRLSPEGKLLASYDVPEGLRLEDGLTGIAVGNRGEVLVEREGGAFVSQLVDASGQVSPKPLDGYIYRGRLYTVHPADLTAKDATRGYVTAGNVHIEIAVTHSLAGLGLLAVNPDDSFFVIVDEVATVDGRIQVDQTVRHFNAAGELLGLARVPLAQRYTPVVHGLAVSSDAAVYTLITRPDHAEIQRLRFSHWLEPILPAVPSESTLQSSEDGRATALSCVTRDSMMNIAGQYVNNSVYLSTVNTDGTCAGRYKPRYLAGAGTYSSVPYDWGGFDTVSEFNSYMHPNTLQAGDYCDGVTIPCTKEDCSRGVDCSGFVSRVWQTTRHTTRDIDQISYPLGSHLDLRRGDILNWYDEHVVLFENFGNECFWVYESTTYDRVDRVVHWCSPFTRLRLDRYQPRRYNNVCPEDTCPAPGNLRATAVSQTHIYLTWQDTCNNETGFKIYRDGSYVTTVGAGVTSWTDTDRTCGTTYSYYVKAINAAGESPASNTATARTYDCSGPSGNWRVEYFSDTNLGSRCSEASETTTYVFKDWREDAPASGCPSDNWSARFTKRVHFRSGSYTFALGSDDRGRIKVGSDTVVDNWERSQHYEIRNLSEGDYDVTVEFAEFGGHAKLAAWWWGPGFDMPRQSQDPNQWYALYWGNMDQWWDPIVRVNEGTGPLSHAWYANGPGWGLPDDRFSARFERTVNFACGRYRFHLFRDDGARVFIDGNLIPGLDLWREGREDNYAEVDITAGNHTIRVDHYENGGWADIALDWTMISGCRPNAPSNLNAVAASQSQINLSWTDNSDTEQGFKVYRNSSEVAQVGANVTSYQDTGLACGTSYSYYVKAYNAYGESDPSNTVLVTTQQCDMVDLVPYQGPGWQFPVVPASVTGTTTTTVLYAGLPTYFDWGVKNQGTLRYNANCFISVDLFIDDALILRNYFNLLDPRLGPGGAIYVLDWRYVVDTPGWHRVRIVVDSANAVIESDESNNAWERYFYWQPDSTPPTGRITQPTNGSIVSSCPLLIRAEANDSQSGVAWVRFWARYDGEWHSIATDSDGSDGWSASWDCSPVSDQEVTLTIWIRDNAGNEVQDPGGYVYVRLSQPCPDPYEPNESFDTATSISPGVPYEAYICSGTDQDYYKFQVSAGQVITVELSSLPADFDLKLYDPARQLKGSSTMGGTADERIVYTANQSGYWYAHVYGWSGAHSRTDPYALRVTLSVLPPSAPQLISPPNGTVFNEQDSITLSWSATGSEYYGEVWGSPAGTMPFGWQSSTSKTIGPQRAGYTYSWRVKARNSAGESPWSSTWTFTVRPAAPTGLSALATSCSQVNLSWNDNSGNEEGYNIYRNGVRVGQVGTNVTSYQDTGLSQSTTYTYYVRAYRGSIESASSNTATATTPACPAPKPDLVPSRWPGWQYPIVPSSITGTTVVNTLYAYRPTYIDWGISNVGNADCTGNAYGDLYIDSTRVAHYNFDRVPVGQTRALFDWVQTINTPGWHTLKFIADPDNLVAESDESNNAWERQFYWEPDSTPPTGRITQPTNGSTINSCPLLIRAEANDSQSGVAWVRFWARYDGEWHSIATDSNGSDGWSASWDCSPVSDQEVTLTIWIRDNAGNEVWDPGGYVYVRLSQPCSDPYEPNETFDTATSISPGVTYEAYICSGTDQDYYKFQVSAGQVITVELSSLPADFDLKLYDPARQLAGSSTKGGTADEQIVRTADQSGHWYALVYGFSGASSRIDPYALKVTLPGINLAPNPGFEEADASGAAPMGWQANYWAGPRPTFRWTADVRRSGQRAVQITNAADETKSRWQSRKVEVESDVSYRFGVWVKGQNVADATWLLIEFLGADGVTTLGYAQTNTLRGTFDWTELTGTLVTPGGTRYLRLELRLRKSGTVWFDDVMLERSGTPAPTPSPSPSPPPSPSPSPSPCPTPPPGNLAPNPGFEEADPSGAAPMGWQANYWAGPRPTFRWTADVRRSGQRAVQIINAADETKSRWQSRKVEVESGVSYRFGVWVKGQDVADATWLLIEFLGADGVTTLGYAQTNTLRGTFDWTELTGTLVTPGGTRYLRLELRLRQSGTVWFDDVLLQRQ